MSVDQLFVLFILYAISSWILAGVQNTIQGIKLMEYLKEHHREKRNYLTWVPIWGSGGHNGFRTLPFIYSNDDLGDRVVSILKDNCRRSNRLVFAIFLTMMPLFVLLMLVYK